MPSGKDHPEFLENSPVAAAYMIEEQFQSADEIMKEVECMANTMTPSILNPKNMITSNPQTTLKSSEGTGTTNHLFGSFNVVFEDINNEQVNASLLENEMNSIMESLNMAVPI